MSLDKEEEFIPVRKSTLIFVAVYLSTAIDELASKLKIPAEACFDMLLPSVCEQIEELPPEREANIMKCYDRKEKHDLN